MHRLQGFHDSMSTAETFIELLRSARTSISMRRSLSAIYPLASFQHTACIILLSIHTQRFILALNHYPNSADRSDDVTAVE